jgi:hypothetical protein
MPIKYIVNKELKLLYSQFYGEVNLNDCLQYAQSLFSDKEVLLATSTLAYLKDSTLIFKAEDVEEFARIITGNDKFHLRQKIAILVDNPIDTVAATLYTQAIKNKSGSTKSELYYTLDAALLFLDLLSEKEKITRLMSEHSHIQE